MWVHFYRMYIPSTGSGCGWSVTVYLNLTLKSQVKGIFGWKDKTCSLSSGGSYNLGVMQPPLSQGCGIQMNYSGPLIASGNYSFSPVNTSYRALQIYGGWDIWKYIYAPQNVLYSLSSSSYSHCIGKSVSINR